MSKTVLTVVGIVLIIMGAVWIAQGLNYLGGSFMTGQRHWAVIGAVVALAGAGLLAFNRRQQGSR